MVIKSRYPELNLSSVDIYTFLFKRKDRKFPDEHPIFRDGPTNKTYTFGELRQLAEIFGKGLRSQYDWQKGDVLAISSASDIDMPPLRDSGAKAIITHYSNIEAVRKACSAVGIPEDHIIILGHGKDPTGRFKHWTNVRNLANTARFVARKIDPRKDAA
ncbi:hypothetical protein LTR28_000449, partial [Elasticomyces elasticus]